MTASLPEYLLSLQWLQDLETLAVRYSHLGVYADMAHMTLPELWGAYQFLSRISEQI